MTQPITNTSEPRRLKLEELRPKDLPDYMLPAWVGFIHWAIGSEQVRADFAKATGMTWRSPRSGIDLMIDEATGYTVNYIQEFISWANTNIWGSDATAD